MRLPDQPKSISNRQSAGLIFDALAMGPQTRAGRSHRAAAWLPAAEHVLVRGGRVRHRRPGATAGGRGEPARLLPRRPPDGRLGLCPRRDRRRCRRHHRSPGWGGRPGRARLGRRGRLAGRRAASAAGAHVDGGLHPQPAGAERGARPTQRRNASASATSCGSARRARPSRRCSADGTSAYFRAIFGRDVAAAPDRGGRAVLQPSRACSPRR